MAYIFFFFLNVTAKVFFNNALCAWQGACEKWVFFENLHFSRE